MLFRIHAPLFLLHGAKIALLKLLRKKLEGTAKLTYT